MSTISESPLAAGEIWAGRADAYVRRMRTSAHVAGRAYLTKSGYRFDDFAPYVYRTGDYGATWIRFRPASRPRR